MCDRSTIASQPAGIIGKAAYSAKEHQRDGLGPSQKDGGEEGPGDRKAEDDAAGGGTEVPGAFEASPAGVDEALGFEFPSNACPQAGGPDLAIESQQGAAGFGFGQERDEDAASQADAQEQQGRLPGGSIFPSQAEPDERGERDRDQQAEDFAPDVESPPEPPEPGQGQRGGDQGNTIHCFNQTYHDNATNPVRLLTIDVDAGTIHSTIYCPLTDATKNDGSTFPVSDVTWIGADLDVPVVTEDPENELGRIISVGRFLVL